MLGETELGSASRAVEGDGPSEAQRAAVIASILQLQRALEEMNSKTAATAAGNEQLVAENETLTEYIDHLMVMFRRLAISSRDISSRAASEPPPL